MRRIKTTTFLFIAFAIALGGCEVDPATHATTHGEATQPLLAVVAVASPSGGRQLLLLPMRSRRTTTDWALQHGTRVDLSEFDAVVAALPENTRLIAVPANAYEDFEGRLFDLDAVELDALERKGAPVDNEIGQTVRGLAQPPAFNWGAGAASKGNCYRYAVNDPMRKGEPHSPFPGGKDPKRRITCADIIGGAKKDGAVDTNKAGVCPIGTYKICAAIQDATTPGANNDYHFWQQGAGGAWTNKPGRGAVRGGGNPSLRKNRGTYDRFCGCVCVPLGPVFMDIDAAHARHLQNEKKLDTVDDEDREAATTTVEPD